MEIRLYKNFVKRRNSTRRVDTTAGTVYNCRLKERTSIHDPVIILQLDSTNSIWPDYTLAYISDFDKYYFVKDAVSDGRFWEISLEEDVLATYKYIIGNEYLYVTRSSATYDGDIIDTMYPAGTNATTATTTAQSPWAVTDTSEIDVRQHGCFVLGIVTNPANTYTGLATYGSVTYYACNSAALIHIVRYLLDNNSTASAGITATDVSNGLIKCMVQPTQFIKSCIWLPYPIAFIGGDQNESSIDIWGYEISFNTGREFCRLVIANPPKRDIINTLTVTKHPLTATRGNWVNATLTENVLYYPGFGNIQLDAAVLANHASITTDVTLDYISGVGILDVKAGNFSIVRTSAQIGVPIQLSEVTYDTLGLATSALGAVGGVITAGITGNVLGAVGALGSFVGSAAQALSPRLYNSGSNGGYGSLSGSIKLMQRFQGLAHENNVRNGRPLCQVKLISDIPGYIKCLNGDLHIDATLTEKQEIKTFLEGGFYYE